MGVLIKIFTVLNANIGDIMDLILIISITFKE